MPNTSRDTYANNLVSQLGAKEYVFGGYVRDKLARVDFSDLDICFESEISFADWRLRTTSKDKVRWEFVIKYHDTRVVSATYDNIHFELQAWKGSYPDGTSINVDAYIARNTSVDITQNYPIGNCADIDINCFYSKNNGMIGMAYLLSHLYRSTDVVEIIDRCKARTYNVINQNKFTSARKQKIELKGFSNLHHQNNEFNTKVNAEMSSVKNDSPMKNDMPASLSMFERFKKNAVEGAYLGTAMSITDGTQAAILAFLKDEGIEESAIPAIAKFFGTNIGKALIAMAAGTSMQFGMQAVPAIAENVHANKIADKLQENGAALGFSAAQKLMFEYMAPMIMGALNKIPVTEPIKTRITETHTGIPIDMLKEHVATIEAQAVQESPKKLAVA